MRQPNSHRRRGSRVNIANRASTPAQTNLRSRRSVVIQTFTFTDSLRVIASKREQTSGLFSTPNRMWMQLNSTNGGSAHDMVSLARQTERSLNPAGFTSGAHLVKGQQKVSARRGHIKNPLRLPQWRWCFLTPTLMLCRSQERLQSDKRQQPRGL